MDMLLSAVSVLVFAQSSSEILEGLMNNPVHILATGSIFNTYWLSDCDGKLLQKSPVQNFKNICHMVLKWLQVGRQAGRPTNRQT